MVPKREQQHSNKMTKGAVQLHGSASFKWSHTNVSKAAVSAVEVVGFMEAFELSGRGDGQEEENKMREEEWRETTAVFSNDW